MLDERDLQAIAQIIDSKIQESEQRMTAKIEASGTAHGRKNRRICESDPERSDAGRRGSDGVVL